MAQSQQTHTLEMQESDEMDITFIVDGVEIKGRSTSVASQSRILRDLIEKNPQRVDLGNTVTPETFMAIMRYINTSEMTITESNAHDMLRAATAFALDHLEQLCVLHFREVLSPSNLCELIKKASLFNSRKLLSSCLEYFGENIDKILESKESLDLSDDVLVTLYDADRNNVSEVVLFSACVKWARNKCRITNAKETPENIRTVFGDIMKKIRFSTMPMDEFRKNVVSTKILSKVQVCQVIHDMQKNERHCTISEHQTGDQLGSMNCRDQGQPSQQGQLKGNGGKEDIVLHRAENPWKPSMIAKTSVSADQEISETEVIFRKIRSILNKITPQKFTTLVRQFVALGINTEEKLKGTVDLIFEKAVKEPRFSAVYAQLCKQLSSIKVPVEGGSKDVSFRSLLLNACQDEFEYYITDKNESAMDDVQKKKIQEELSEALSKAKQRLLGNIRFIGELYKLQMLTETIMHLCILKLLKSADADSYECLCRLLSTIGKDIDHEKAKLRMDQYFQHIDKIIKQKRTSSRVRFMLQDVYDLRKNRWVPRRADNALKTIDKIHKEVQMEDQQRQIMLANMPAAPRGGGGNRRGGGRQGTPGQQGEDGWQMTKSTYRSNNIDPQKMRLSKHLYNNQLGPGGRPDQFNSWGRGSSGEEKTSSQEGECPSTPGNRFSALTQSNVSDSSRTTGRGQTPSRDSKGRTTTPRPPSKMVARASQEQDRESALSAVRSLVSGGGQRTPTGSRNQSRDSSRSRDIDRDAEAMPPPATPQSGPAAKGISDDEMAKKTIAVMDEYLHINDLKEAVLCIKELESPKNIHLFVTNAINHVLERSPQARKQTGSLLHDVVKQNVISVQSYIQGLLEVLEYAEDMEVDIPMIWKYMGELIGPMVQDGSVPLSFLKEVAEPIKQCNKAGMLVAEVLHAAAQNIGNIKVGELWRKSSLVWSYFVPPTEIDNFIKKHKLEFTVGGEQPRSSETKSLSIDQIMSQLEELIIKRREDNEHVFYWIEGNVGEPQSKEAPFIRALMTVVCRSAIVGEETGDIKMRAEAITSRSILLQKYLDHNGELELQALYALQALVHKLHHPAGLLRSFFDILYDEHIISEDAFNQWDSSNDQAESAGKGVAKQSVLQFFIWLREAEDESLDEL